MQGKNKHIMRKKMYCLGELMVSVVKMESGGTEALRSTCCTSYYLVVPGRVQPSAELCSISNALCHLFS